MAENAEEGAESPEWDVNGAGDPSIQGFADASSYRGGENVILRVKTDAVQVPRPRIYQMDRSGFSNQMIKRGQSLRVPGRAAWAEKADLQRSLGAGGIPRGHIPYGLVRRARRQKGPILFPTLAR